MNLDSRQATTLPAAGAAIVFNDADTTTTRRSLTVFDAKGQEVALTYYSEGRHGSMERLRHANAAPWPAPPPHRCRSRRSTLPPTGSAPLAAAGCGELRRSLSVTAAGAETMAITGIQLDLARPRSTARASASPNIEPETVFRRPADGDRDRTQRIVSARYSNGQSRPPGRWRSDVPQPAGPAADRRQRLGAQLYLGRPDRRRARRRQPRPCLQAGALGSNVDSDRRAWSA